MPDAVELVADDETTSRRWPYPVYLPRHASQFDEVLTTARTPIIELNSVYGATALRNITTVAGTGAVSTSSTGEILVKTGATASSTALLQSAEYGRYMPGFGAQVGIGIRIPTAPTGDHIVRWGLFTANEGVYFGQDATGVFVARRRGGTETKVYQTSWNIDRLDGIGDSLATLDATDGNVFQIDFTWYGYGAITFSVVIVKDNMQRLVKVHTIDVDDSTSLQDPNLPIAVKAENGTTASDFEVYVGGRQYSIIGRYEPIFRYTGAARGSLATSTTIKPTVTLRRKSSFLNRSVKLDGFDVIAATEPVVVEIRLDGSLTSASYATPTNHTAAETALEMDISATAISGGEVIFTALVPAGNGQRVDFGSLNGLQLDIPAQEPVSLCVRTLTGTGTAICALRMREEW